MPARTFAILIVSVIAAAGLTILMLDLCRPAAGRSWRRSTVRPA